MITLLKAAAASVAIFIIIYGFVQLLIGIYTLILKFGIELTPGLLSLAVIYVGLTLLIAMLIRK